MIPIEEIYRYVPIARADEFVRHVTEKYGGFDGCDIEKEASVFLYGDGADDAQEPQEDTSQESSESIESKIADVIDDRFDEDYLLSSEEVEWYIATSKKKGVVYVVEVKNKNGNRRLVLQSQDASMIALRMLSEKILS